jgi:predicted ferric reductase
VWTAIYVLAVLAPAALAVVAVPRAGGSSGVVLAAALGFAALAVLALQLVMPSRSRHFTPPFGIALLLRFHRRLGQLALALVLAHVVVLFVDDPRRLALLNLPAAPGRARAADVATLALVAIIVCSVWRRRLRLGYEAWRGLHIVLGVLVLVFAVIHVLGVARYLDVPSIRWTVLAFAAVGVGAVFYLRLGRPFAARARPYRIEGIRQERGAATTLTLVPAGHPGLSFTPGQFAWIKLADAPYSLTEHPFSFSSSAARPERPEFTIKALGDFTERVARLARGQYVLIDGPHGSFAPSPDTAGFVLLAGGIGITPMISLVRTLADTGDRRPVVLIYANRSWEEVTFREQLDELEALLDLQVIHVLSRPSEAYTGERGRVDAQLLGRTLPLAATAWTYFICGAPAFTESTLSALADLGVGAENVHAERFAAV